MEKEQKPRERSFIRELVPDWRPTREQVLWTVRIVIVVVLLLGILTLIGLAFDITLWEWVKLLIVPAVIAAGGLWFNRQQRDRELEIAEQRSQDEALQAYLDQMSQLLLDKGRPLRQSKEGDELRTLARARTLTVLRRLDGERKSRVLQFLNESQLIAKDHVILDLKGADLSEASLSEANLSEANLQGAHLIGANLTLANLSGAYLSLTNLSEANLTRANLSEANLRWANLSEVNLSKAKVLGANLSGASLSGAYGWTLVDSAAVESLEGATMPNGQKYEDWLKDKESREEDEKNE